MRFSSPLLRGTLLRRYRRSLADVRLDDGDRITAHVFSLGSMAGCSEPGRPVLVSDSGDVTRHHPMTWELIDMNGTWVGVNPTVSRKILRQAILDGEIRNLRGYSIQSEAVHGKKKRVDFILQNMKENCFINVQGVTWAEKGCAWFPDVATEPPRKSLNDLADIAREGHRAIAFFHVLRGDCKRMKPAAKVDKEYARTLRRAKRAGVEIRVFKASVSPEEITLGVPIPCIID